MDKEEKKICLSVIEIMKNVFAIPEEMLGQENWKKCLTSKEFGLRGVELVYLLFEIEKTYGVRISSDSFDNHGFNSIVGIAKAVQKEKL